MELCENDPQGGTTPSAGTIETALELADPHGTPVHVMIRPRGGGFVYDRDEQTTMLRDVATAVRLGAHGLVVGVVTAEGDVDVDLLQRLISAGSGLSVTFHRAVDVARTIEVAVEMAFDLGCDRVLTSGGAPTAVSGAAMLAQLVRNAPDGRSSWPAVASPLTPRATSSPTRSCPRSTSRPATTEPTDASPSQPGMVGVTAGPGPELADERLARTGHRAPRPHPGRTGRRCAVRALQRGHLSTQAAGRESLVEQ